MNHLIANHILIPEIGRMLAEGKRVLFTPTGDSMRPFIEGGQDKVVLLKKQKVRVGDICLAQLPAYPDQQLCFVLHRVVAVQGEQVTMKGDGNIRGEEHCMKNDILGTVVRIETPWGHRKWITNGWIWRTLCRPRWFWLKVYRHTIRKYMYN
ncbi:MAG: S24/S26 family peptidase [Paludibacteraceae bacterium]|nr:S24/S26 family peptidase [Paludibacteraceae bacterium]